MDIVVGLPLTLDKFDSIWVVVDRLIKLVHILPMKVSYNVTKFDKMYIQEIFQLHGVTIFFISDRGMQLTLKFLSSIQSELCTQLEMSINFHPQMDVQLERIISVL